MDYRRLGPEDVPQAVDFAVTGIRPHLYPSLRLSTDKVRASIEHFMRSDTDFHIAAFDGRRLVGGAAAAVYESPMFERCEATVMLFRATEQGVGAELFRRLRAWVDSDMRVRRVHFPQEFDASPAMSRLLRINGFRRAQIVCAYEKG